MPSPGKSLLLDASPLARPCCGFPLTYLGFPLTVPDLSAVAPDVTCGQVTGLIAATRRGTLGCCTNSPTDEFCCLQSMVAFTAVLWGIDLGTDPAHVGP